MLTQLRAEMDTALQRAAEIDFVVTGWVLALEAVRMLQADAVRWASAVDVKANGLPDRLGGLPWRLAQAGEIRPHRLVVAQTIPRERHDDKPFART